MTFRWKLAQFFEIRWWHHYLRNKDVSTYLDWKKAYWRDFLKHAGMEVPLGACVLDAGCGPAGIFMVLDGRQVEALDPLLGQYERELAHFKRTDYPNVRFVESPLESFEPPKLYDWVFCLNAINHVADLKRCFDRLAALTAPGGTIAISVDAHNYPWLKHLFRAIPGDVLHPHQYDLKEYESLLDNKECRIVRTLCLKKEMIFGYYLLVAQKSGI